MPPKKSVVANNASKTIVNDDIIALKSDLKTLESRIFQKVDESYRNK